MVTLSYNGSRMVHCCLMVIYMWTISENLYRCVNQIAGNSIALHNRRKYHHRNYKPVLYAMGRESTVYTYIESRDSFEIRPHRNINTSTSCIRLARLFRSGIARLAADFNLIFKQSFELFSSGQACSW